MDTCKSCGARIRWVRMPTDKMMPIDDEPHPEGTVGVHSDGTHAAVLTVDEIRALRDLPTTGEAPVPLYRSHFATCPHAKQHRRKS